jgi:hypothetical protein
VSSQAEVGTAETSSSADRGGGQLAPTEADQRPPGVVRLKKKVSFKESVAVQSAESGLSTAEQLKSSPGSSRLCVEGGREDRSQQEEVMTVVSFATLGHKGSPSYVRHAGQPNDHWLSLE